MLRQESSFDIQHLLRIALILWIGYFLVLALVDWLFVSDKLNVLLYYGVQMLNGLIILGFTHPFWRRLCQEKVLLPITLALMTGLPTMTLHIMIRLAPSRFLRDSVEMTLRLTPILLIGLLLTAWHYRWRHVVIFCLTIAMLNIIGIWGLPPLGRKPPPPPPPPSQVIVIDSPESSTDPIPKPQLTQSITQLPQLLPANRGMVMTLLQTLILLIVGYFTSALMSHLRAQQRSLEEANAQLRHQAITSEKLAISRERNRMARELHDTVAHTLSALSVQLQTVQAYWDVEPATSQMMLANSLDATRSGLQETRRALKALRATPLEDLGLTLAIQRLAESAAQRANLELTLSIKEPLPSFMPEVAQCLYRIAQEAIANVIYHADAKQLSIRLEMKEGLIELEIQDDGLGFDVEGQYPGHWGLQGMYERAELVSGQLSIQSQRGHGTTIQLAIQGSA